MQADLQILKGFEGEAKKIGSLSCNQRIKEIKRKLQGGLPEEQCGG